eukprot:3539161-Prymnesium_polylepis.1
MIEPIAHRQSNEYPTTLWGLRAAWAGRWTLLSRVATGSAGGPSPTGSLRSCSLPLLYCHDADRLGCGRGRHRFDA